MTREDAEDFTEHIFAATDPMEVLSEICHMVDKLPPATNDEQAMGAIVGTLMGLHLQQVADQANCPVGIAMTMSTASLLLMGYYAPLLMACIRVANALHSALGEPLSEEAGAFDADFLKGMLGDERPPEDEQRPPTE